MDPEPCLDPGLVAHLALQALEASSLSHTSLVAFLLVFLPVIQPALLQPLSAFSALAFDSHPELARLRPVLWLVILIHL